MIALIAEFEEFFFPGVIPGLIGLAAGLLLALAGIAVLRAIMPRSRKRSWLAVLIGFVMVIGGVAAGFAYRVNYQPWVHSLELGFKEMPPERIDRELEAVIAAQNGVIRTRVIRSGERITIHIELRGTQRFSVPELCQQLGYGKTTHYSGHQRSSW